jgi:hypothetical protein
MNQLSGSLSGLSGWRVAIALVGLFFATVASQCQSEGAALIPGCPISDQHALAGHSPIGNSNSEPGETDVAIGAASAVILDLRGTSFSELAHIDLRVRTFRSQSDYLRTRFSFSRFLLFLPMQYFVDVNPALFQEQAPSDGVCAILAHELVHIVSLSRGNRIRRFGLVRLLSKRQTTKFERRTDLEAIHRGYGDGLRSYRKWIYAHISPNKLPEKRRNYFSPEEIGALQILLQERPELFGYWRRHVPMNLQEIQSGRRPR